MGTRFCNNILEEKSGKRQDLMISYLMEDAPGRGAKAAHAVLLCEMERGSLQWEDTDRLDQILRAHAQKHFPSSKSSWGVLTKKIVVL